MLSNLAVCACFMPLLFFHTLAGCGITREELVFLGDKHGMLGIMACAYV